MKIFEIGTGYTPIPAQMGAATEIVVEELTRAFLEQGVSAEIVDIASCDRAPTDLPIREVAVPGWLCKTDVRLGVMHKLKRVAYSIALAGELKKILRTAQEPVIFHFHNQYNLFFFLKLAPKALRKKVRIAYTNHSGIWRMDWQQIEAVIRKRYFQEAECMQKADLVFLLNEETRANIMKHLNVPAEKVKLISNGVNTQVYRPLSQDEKSEARAAWGLNGQRVILQVGSVCENKGQLRSLQVLLPLMKEEPSLTYVYAGGIVDEEYHQKIGVFARDNGVEGQVRYLGMVSPGRELNAVYNMAEATIFSSGYESFGMVVIESFSAGVPVLVDRRGPGHLGKGNIFYDQENIADVLKRYVFDEREAYDALCSEARKTAVEQYSWQCVAQDHLNAWMA